MERQLANLTGLVQKALIQTVPSTTNINQNYLGVPGQYRGEFPIQLHVFSLSNFHNYRVQQYTENKKRIFFQMNK